MTEAEFAYVAIIFAWVGGIAVVVGIGCIPLVDFWLERRKKKRSS